MATPLAGAARHPDAHPGGPPTPAVDRTKPKLTIRRLSHHRISIRANEAVTVRVAKKRFALRPARTKTVRLKHGRFTLKATDLAGNTRTVRLRIR